MDTDYPKSANPGEETEWLIYMREGTVTVRMYLPLIGKWIEVSRPLAIGDKRQITLPVEARPIRVSVAVPEAHTYLTASGLEMQLRVPYTGHMKEQSRSR